MLILVEWAKAGIVPPGFAKLDPRFAHQVENIYFGFDLINAGHGVVQIL
jgi:hypothetical protein